MIIYRNDFVNLLIRLKQIAKRYCLIVASCDTPWGMALNQELAAILKDIGFQIDLFGQYRQAYAAVIDAGNLVFEMLGEALDVPVQKTLYLNGNEIVIHSSGFYADKTFSSIKINGKEHSSSTEGLTFVVYDKVNNAVLDSLCFDFTRENVFFHPISYYRQTADKFLSEHPGVTFVGCKHMRFPNDYLNLQYNSNLTSYERFLLNNMIDLTYVAENYDKMDCSLKKYYDSSQINELLTPPRSYIDYDGVKQLEDQSGDLVNTVNGHRVTAYQPKPDSIAPYICIYLIGGCLMFGTGSSDDKTIASFLQKQFNELAPQYKVIVENYGNFLFNLKDSEELETRILNSLPARPGDIVIWEHALPDTPLIDLTKAIYEPRDFDVFFDRWHYTPDGNRLTAQKLFKGLIEQGIIENAQKNKANAEINQNASPRISGSGFDQATNSQLLEYKRFLCDLYNRKLKRSIGAIVMNCNPFTLGHRYLIEKAKEQCDHLIVFLVEEDKSFFSFEDRMKLVKEGTRDIPNLEVIPSGKFVLSLLTFSGYFNKSELQDKVIDASLDVTLFAREIAPCLQITKRFAGEEPLDNVTRQYNETMRSTLPVYGIEFIEIPRRELDGAPISASRVRALLEARDFDAIKNLVPDSTYKYLLTKFS